MNQNLQKHQSSKRTFLFCGGGSGGHLYPAIAVCEELQTRLQGNCRFIFLTTGKSIEEKVLADLNIERVPISAINSNELRRQPVRSALSIVRSVLNARRILKQYRPDVVVGLGGYGSLPGVLAARTCNIPRLLMEQNSLPGRANELLARLSNVVCTSYPESFKNTSSRVRVLQTGNPVRKSISDLQNSDLVSSPPTLTILGGSQGASAMNLAMLSIIKTHPEIFKGWKVIHQTGQSDNSSLEESYRQGQINALVREFIEDITSVYQQTRLVLSRAGATTLAELAVLGLPAVLVPYPNSVRDHQLKNAKVYEKLNAVVIVQQVEQAEFTAYLLEQLQQLITSPTRIDEMRAAMKSSTPPNATMNVVDEILKLT